MSHSNSLEYLRTRPVLPPEILNQGTTFKMERLNSVAFLATHKPVNPDIFQFAPHKIQTRLLLTNSGWCGLPTVFVPSNDAPSLEELVRIQAMMNKVNEQAGRPIDTDMILRTSRFKDGNPRWTEPAYLLKNIGTDRQVIKSLGEEKATMTYAGAMERTKSGWIMCHTDNFPLQQKAIHGRLSVQGDELSLEVGTGVPHARALENGQHTIVKKPLNMPRSFFDSDMFVPNSLTIVGDHTATQTEWLMSELAPAGKQLSDFVRWVRDHLDLQRYIVEFRHYLGSGKDKESFHVLDLNERF